MGLYLTQAPPLIQNRNWKPGGQSYDPGTHSMAKVSCIPTIFGCYLVNEVGRSLEKMSRMVQPTAMTTTSASSDSSSIACYNCGKAGRKGAAPPCLPTPTGKKSKPIGPNKSGTRGSAGQTWCTVYRTTTHNDIESYTQGAPRSRTSNTHTAAVMGAQIRFSLTPTITRSSRRLRHGVHNIAFEQTTGTARSSAPTQGVASISAGTARSATPWVALSYRREVCFRHCRSCPRGEEEEGGTCATVRGTRLAVSVRPPWINTIVSPIPRTLIVSLEILGCPSRMNLLIKRHWLHLPVPT